MHHVRARILVGLVDQHAADAARRHRRRQLRANRVGVGVFLVLLVRERSRLAGSRIEHFDIRPFAAAAGGVDQLGRTNSRLLGQELDAESRAARFQDRVLGIGVLRE